MLLWLGALLIIFLVMASLLIISLKKQRRRFGDNESGAVENIAVQIPARYKIKEEKAKVGNKSSVQFKKYKKSPAQIQALVNMM